ncbi:hypothetical protein [Jeotgalibacillus proteolyticus]|uniref:Uncharacterized protein n=1 Tax=Jeotgalibacillus proteolyticus TaxID=2082395 RepID=A0A2S5GDS3_9BACL|nr:hypothetical protein [Jeotgalibacillus proteolyticus]PPA71061.1 hypothetical protein C4B60_09810 [Jeotgalibacillus proteolyticus]
MLFIVIVFSIPVYILAIWGLHDPEDAILFLQRWRYNETPEFSEWQFKLFKFGNIGAIVFMTLIIVLTGIETFRPAPEFTPVP